VECCSHLVAMMLGPSSRFPNNTDHLMPAMCPFDGRLDVPAVVQRRSSMVPWTHACHESLTNSRDRQVNMESMWAGRHRETPTPSSRCHTTTLTRLTLISSLCLPWFSPSGPLTPAHRVIYSVLMVGFGLFPSRSFLHRSPNLCRLVPHQDIACDAHAYLAYSVFRISRLFLPNGV